MKRKFVWLVVSCLVAALLVTACGGATEEEEVVTPEEEKASKEIPFPPMPVDIGQRVANELLAVTLTEVKIVDSYDYVKQGESVTEKAPAGQLFLLAHVIVENTAVRVMAARTGAMKMRLCDAEGNLLSTNKSYFGEERLPADWRLDKGATVRGWALFIFPEEEYDLTLKYNTAEVTFPVRERNVEWLIRPSK